MPPFALYSILISTLCGLSLFSRKHDTYACAAIAVLLIVSSGFRSAGFDYAEYLNIIFSISTSQINDVESLAQVAKDPLFTVIVLSTQFFTDDPHFIFLLISIVSVVPKFLIALSLSRFRALFLGLYAIFLAPGLEFAAIRSGMAVGFSGLLLMGGVVLHKKIGIAVLAVLSHISAILPTSAIVIFKARRLDVFLVTLVAAAAGTYLAFAAFNIFEVIDAVSAVDRSNDYLYDQGNFNNFFFPLTTFGILVMAAAWIFDRQVEHDFSAFPQGLCAAGLLCATAFGAALPVSSFVLRILEFAWFFYIYTMLELFAQERSGFIRSGFVFWIALMVFVNIHRETWVVMEPEVSWLNVD